jgi:hypothetical protein
MSVTPALANLLLSRGPFTSHFAQGQCGHHFASTLSLSLSFPRITRYCPGNQVKSRYRTRTNTIPYMYSPAYKTNTKHPRRRSAGGAHITGRRRCRRFSRGSMHARRSAGSTHTAGRRRCHRCSRGSTHPRRRSAGGTCTAGRCCCRCSSRGSARPRRRSAWSTHTSRGAAAAAAALVAWRTHAAAQLGARASRGAAGACREGTSGGVSCLT